MPIAALDYFQMGMGLFGGLAIFLFGMEQMTATLKAVAGDGMKRILARLTTNRFKAVGAGAFVTAVIQSSSVTTVLVVGFVSAGLMSLQQSIGMIMGAEIGTTVTAQIIAFKVTGYALVAVAVGFAMQFFSKHERVCQYGLMIFGFGLIFFGMFLMGEAMKPLRTHQPFIELMGSMENPLLAILVSAAFTGLIQSSSATTAIIIMLAKSGFISLDAGIALAFGANIGTCVTALLASIGKPREAVQTAMVHLTFNVAGVLLWVGFIDQLAALVTSLSPAHTDVLDATERLMAEDTAPDRERAHDLQRGEHADLHLGSRSRSPRSCNTSSPFGPESDARGHPSQVPRRQPDRHPVARLRPCVDGTGPHGRSGGRNDPSRAADDPLRQRCGSGRR